MLKYNNVKIRIESEEQFYKIQNYLIKIGYRWQNVSKIEYYPNEENFKVIWLFIYNDIFLSYSGNKKYGAGCRDTDISEEIYKIINEENIMTLQDLKTGMLVRTRDKKLRLVIANSIIGIGASGGMGLFNYNNDFKSCQYSSFDIIEVYSEPFSKYIYSAGIELWLKQEAFLKHCELLWKEEEVIEMTMEDVCKALGKNIKIVK